MVATVLSWEDHRHRWRKAIATERDATPELGTGMNSAGA